LFRSSLEQILNKKHPLYVLANKIDWSHCQRAKLLLHTGFVGISRYLSGWVLERMVNIYKNIYKSGIFFGGAILYYLCKNSLEWENGPLVVQ